MPRYFDTELYHSWGNSPKAKAAEREYNAWYYQTYTKKKRARKGSSGKTSNDFAVQKEKEYQSEANVADIANRKAAVAEDTYNSANDRVKNPDKYDLSDRDRKFWAETRDEADKEGYNQKRIAERNRDLAAKAHRDSDSYREEVEDYNRRRSEEVAKDRNSPEARAAYAKYKASRAAKKGKAKISGILSRMR